MRVIDTASVISEPQAVEATEYLPDGTVRRMEDAIMEESTLDVRVNGQMLYHITCLATDLAPLVAGRLITDGLISGPDDIVEIVVSDGEPGASPADDRQADPAPESPAQADRGRTPLRAEVTLANADAPIAKRKPATIPTHGDANRAASDAPTAHAPVVPIPWSPDWILELASVFEADTPSHAATFATHSCYLATSSELLWCCEDLGRHNAFDKALGRALIEGVDLEQCIIFTSGRIPTDMVMKAIVARVPILVSKAVPTGRTLQLARRFDLTLICSAHADAIRVFNDPTAR